MADPAGTGDDDRALVRVEREGPVTRLVLDSPHNRNALSNRMLTELDAALREVEGDRSVRAVVLTAEGPVFCAGADLSERLENPGVGSQSAFPDVLRRIVGLTRPVVAEVNGHVRAGGIGLVAACDVAVAPTSATFAFSEVRVGVAPAIIAVPALRVMTRRAFARYAMSGDTFSAHEARAAGLLSATVDAAEIKGWVDEILDGFLRSSPAAIAATKQLFEVVWEQDWEAAVMTASRLSDEAFASADAREGIDAFLQKRPPSWVTER